MQDRNAGIVDLIAYKLERASQESELEEDHQDVNGIIDELAYHLLKAIQAVKKLSH